MNKKKKKNLKGKEVNKEKNLINHAFRLSSSTYFLTFRGFSPKLARNITKEELKNYLLNDCKINKRLAPEKYLICQEMYDSGQPHFHAILVYPKRKQIKLQDSFDYQDIHPNIQTMRNMKAALQYVYKEDPSPLTNMDIIQQKRIARAKDSSSLYELLEQQMIKNPFRFNVQDYCATHGIFKQIYKANYAKAITLIKMAQPAYARMVLEAKPGIKPITTTLINQQLNPDEIIEFYSHPCYQKIIDHVNQIHKYPNKDEYSMAPLKTKHLLIVGEADIGKTSLIYHRANPESPYPGLSHYYATYYLSVGQKYFPPYRSFDYRLINWEQFTIDSDLFPKKSYNRLLNYLDGSVSALPQKGRAPIERQDNPKHILTSNLTLKEHIHKTFKSQQSLSKASNNLPARIDCVSIPKGKNIHFLRKLFVPNPLKTQKSTTFYLKE